MLCWGLKCRAAAVPCCAVPSSGNPTLLALIYAEVAARVGLELQAVMLPSHVFLKPKVSKRGIPSK